MKFTTCLLALPMIMAEQQEPVPYHWTQDFDPELPWQHVCTNGCHNGGEMDASIHNALMEHCNNFKFQLPRPKLWIFCKNAFAEGVKLACTNHCGEKPHSKSIAEHKKGQWCKKARRELPKPGCLSACEIGFAAGADAASLYAMNKKFEWQAKMAEGETPKQAEAEMIEEEEIEMKIIEKSGEAKVNVEEVKKAVAAEMKSHHNTSQTSSKTDMELAREAAKAAFAAQAAKISANETDEIDL